ncbi:nucleoside phosphatase GDA1/CD39 [Radiomyces spectabilis]|uniref:nucleoside phosphatase GDA1/CD39 n=1 Tax=Radiomyces spectabilis TaxID=64574 RepID=UPI00221EAE7A|nr:nucleoside phosphatase GDA1/CD39 [Radiomyces spectabilis]KAI8369411.1 nucleoside phosphatase GDA1/CD39 [Radiomyces spectabilis]
MIDAGSSGSRVHVYRFKICHDEPQLEHEEFKMIEPGLSSYKDDPQAAAESLDSLMAVAVDSVPKDQQRCTPIAVKATAGLRLLQPHQSEGILEAVRRHLETRYPFPMAGERAVEIMDGKDEGVYAWITVNYLLGKLTTAQRGRSAAVFDLGGRSTQIVFEPTFRTKETMLEGEHKYQLDYGNENYELYQHSYLGYGLNEANKRIKEELVIMWNQEAQRTGRVYHPCLPEGRSETIEFSFANGTQKVELIGTGAGHAECRAIVERIFNKDKLCKLDPCAFDGMYQPSLSDTFEARDLYVFSYFYDYTQPLGMPSEFSVGELGELTQRVCNGETKPFRHVPQAIDALARNADFCLNLSYIYDLLRFAYEIPSDRLIKTVKKIRGVETGWCLGASIAMLDQVQLCQID